MRSGPLQEEVVQLAERASWTVCSVQLAEQASSTVSSVQLVERASWTMWSIQLACSASWTKSNSPNERVGQRGRVARLARSNSPVRRVGLSPSTGTFDPTRPFDPDSTRASWTGRSIQLAHSTNYQPYSKCRVKLTVVVYTITMNLIRRTGELDCSSDSAIHFSRVLLR